ncbi:TPA: hypothetical protein ACGFGD_001840 [Campylobacter jejuni]|nr:hypothetical protein [Campylobacter jejuni]
MSKNIKTQEAKLDLITKFLDYANCADASYALLDPVFTGVIIDKQEKELEKDLDTQRLIIKILPMQELYKLVLNKIK